QRVRDHVVRPPGRAARVFAQVGIDLSFEQRFGEGPVWLLHTDDVRARRVAFAVSGEFFRGARHFDAAALEDGQHAVEAFDLVIVIHLFGGRRLAGDLLHRGVGFVVLRFILRAAGFDLFPDLFGRRGDRGRDGGLGQQEGGYILSGESRAATDPVKVAQVLFAVARRVAEQRERGGLLIIHDVADRPVPARPGGGEIPRLHFRVVADAR